jgi:hypothetical protein
LYTGAFQRPVTLVPAQLNGHQRITAQTPQKTSYGQYEQSNENGITASMDQPEGIDANKVKSIEQRATQSRFTYPQVK